MSLIVNDLSNICLQRARRQLYNVPITRFELISPYGGIYSMFDLNMRRKAEVLKYSGNATNTKTNNYTKAQLYSQIMKNTNNARVNNKSTNCVVDTCGNLIYRPTTASNVPGPVRLLYDDESVPLYNYATNTRSYPDKTPNDFNLWNIYTITDISCNAVSSAIEYNSVLNTIRESVSPTTIETKLFTLYILSNIDQPTYTYSINTPICVLIQGIYSGYQSSTIHISLNNIQVNVYYNTTIINSLQPNISSLSSLSLNIPGTSGNLLIPFSANVYIGNLVFMIPNLPTLNGYIFDIKLTFTFNTLSLYDISQFSSTDQLYLNTVMNTTNTTAHSSNCTVQTIPTPPTTPYSVFSLTGL